MYYTIPNESLDTEEAFHGHNLFLVVLGSVKAQSAVR